MFPIFLFIKAILELVVAFRSPTGSKTFWHAAFGVVSLIAAVALIARPILAGLTLTLLLIGYFLIDGAVRVFVALRSRTTGWGWVLASGIIDLLLGAYLVTQSFAVSIFVLGVLIGIDILVAGIGMVAVDAQERTHAVHGGMTPA
jgi:uncharacterized membrane protein HdeD (DUF308 family)